MNELLELAIEEIERVLIGNKDRNTEEVYLKNAIRHIREYGSQPQLNENQQQVLGWLKVGHCDGDSVFEALERVTYVYEDPKTEEALESLSPDQEVQVINSFMKWALEQEEEK
jgi:hypothetical protein